MPEPMSDADLAAIRERWTGDFSDKPLPLPGDVWEDIPALLGEVYRLRAELDALEARETTAFLAARDRAEAAEAEVDRLRAKETEAEWEWAEFDADELQPDGTLHRWAEPKDVWDHPLPSDEVAELRGDGSVYAKRRKSAWQIIGAGEQDA